GTENVKVNTPIAVLLADGEDASAASAAPVKDDHGIAESAKNGSGEAHSAPAVTATIPGVPAAAQATVAADPDIPAGTEFGTMTVREALRDAMAEEMRRDPDVFVIGEEVAEYQGAYKITQGLLQEFGADRVIDTPITEHGFAGLATGAAL